MNKTLAIILILTLLSLSIYANANQIPTKIQDAISPYKSPQVSIKGMVVFMYKDGTNKTYYTEPSVVTIIDKVFSELSILHENKEISKIYFLPVMRIDKPCSSSIKAHIEVYVNENLLFSEKIGTEKVTYIFQQTNTDIILLEGMELTEDWLESKLQEGSNKIRIVDTLYMQFDNKVVMKSSIETSFALNKVPPSPTSPQPQVVVETSPSPTPTVTVSAVISSSSQPSQSAEIYVPSISGMSSQEYIKIVEEVTERPYTDQIVVQTRPDGYQPERGSPAAQSQYIYDATDLNLSLDKGYIPPNWIVTRDEFGQITFINTVTKSEVHVGKFTNPDGSTYDPPKIIETLNKNGIYV
ncbi:MAG: hypothetical protein QXS54_08700 [Candidatus Methanomethylicaceae archaeon]